MENTAAVRSAVDAKEFVVACAYVGYEHETFKAALPEGFQARQYVAKFVNGELVALEAGRPEEAFTKLLGQAPPPHEDCEACEDGTCAKPAIPSQ